MRVDARKNYDHLLATAHDVVSGQGALASLRDIARQAGVGLGTLYRHFPTRESLLEALLRDRFDELAVRARDLAGFFPPDEALTSWLREAVAMAHTYSGAISAMVAAIDEPGSALHASCQTMKAAGRDLLVRAQEDGGIRADIDGTDLFALLGALAWLRDQPALASRADHLFKVIAGTLLVAPPSRGEARDA